MTSPVTFQSCESIAPGTIRVVQVVGSQNSLPVEIGSGEGLALAVLKANFRQRHGSAVSLEVTGPPVPDFDTWLGMYLASRSLRNMMWANEGPDAFPDSCAQATEGSIVDVDDLPSHLTGPLRLVSYSQRERKCMTIHCPIPQRLSSLHRALQRLFPGDFKKWELAWDEITKAYSGRDPLFQGPFDERTVPNSWWLATAIQCLKNDRAAYERDLRRATRRQEIGYAMLPRPDSSSAPAEMVRIENPESLLFEVWAWEDVGNSKDAGGFPLVWIDKGWEKPGFEIHLRPCSGFAPLNSTHGLNLDPTYASTGGFSLFWEETGTAKDIRVKLKKGFYAGNQAQFIDYAPPVKSGHDSSAEKSISVDCLINDSDLPQTAQIPDKHKIAPNNWRLCKVKLAAGLDFWGTWVGDEVAKILYSALRPAPEMRLPNDFTMHITRQRGMISVWTREGVAVAYDDKLPKEFEKTFVNIFKLRNDLEEVLTETPSPHKRSANSRSERSLAKRHAEVRQKLAQDPNLRSLRNLFERTQPQELFDAWRDMSETEERIDAEDRHGFLEIGIFIVYLAEMGDIFGKWFFENNVTMLFIWMSIFAIIGMFLAIFLLRPRKKSVPFPGVLLLFLMLLPFLAGAWRSWQRTNEQKPALSQKVKSLSQSPVEAPGAASPARPDKSEATKRSPAPHLKNRQAQPLSPSAKHTSPMPVHGSGKK